MTLLCGMTARKKNYDSDQDKRSMRKRDECGSTSSKLKQYTVLNTTINNVLHNIKDKPFIKRPKPLSDHLAKKKPMNTELSTNPPGTLLKVA